MGSRLGYFRRSPAAVLAGIVLALAAALYALERAGMPREYFCLVAPLVAYSAPLLLLLAAKLEPGPERPTAGELERLLALKRQGALPPARRPPRRPRRWPAARPTLPADPPAGPLDRLVRRKRQWAEPGEDPAQATGAGDE
jgi:hypothetical protein